MEHPMSPKMESRISLSHTELNPLTGLYDSRGFMHQAKSWIPNLSPKAYAMIAIDIAHFRLFNKFYGRDAGDRLLIYIADHLKNIQECRRGLAGYFGSDNFCIIMPFHDDAVRQLKEDLLKGFFNGAI